MKNKKKYLIIGDIHGDIDLMKSIVKKFPKHYMIFLGDMLDSFIFSPRRQVECIQLALQLIKENRATCLMANHEASYLWPHMQCAGWNKETDRLVEPYKQDILDNFSSAVWFEKEKILISHAGFTKQLWDHYRLTPKNLPEIMDRWFRHVYSPYYYIGQDRGGEKFVGGLLWCDWSKFEPVEEIRQIVGHTVLWNREIDQKGENYNIDVLQNAQKSVLELEEGVIREVKL